jgi:carbon-monoxide dehydrogenase small subunit
MNGWSGRPLPCRLSQEVAAAPHQTLLQILRDELRLLGTKRGCDTGGCGCCTVLVDGKAMYSCMIFAMAAQGKKITTIEGLTENATLDPVQQPFIETGAVQCGYCTCGMAFGVVPSFCSSSISPRSSNTQYPAYPACDCSCVAKFVNISFDGLAVHGPSAGWFCLESHAFVTIGDESKSRVPCSLRLNNNAEGVPYAGLEHFR